MGNSELFVVSVGITADMYGWHDYVKLSECLHVEKKTHISLNKKEDNFLILFIGFCSKDSQEQNNDTQ